MSIKNWPIQDRPREKLVYLGPQSLTDVELIAIFLRTGTKNKSAITLAREILLHFGSLRNLFNVDQKEFCKLSGLGIAKYVLLQAALEISKRYLYEKIDKTDIFKSLDDTKLFLRAKLRDRNQEIFACLFLDNKNRCIAYEEIARGTIDYAIVPPREVVKRVFFHNATAVIFAHNHPSGFADPSLADIEITRRLQKVLTLLEIRLLDHLIIGDGDIISFSELGHID